MRFQLELMKSSLILTQFKSEPRSAECEKATRVWQEHNHNNYKDHDVQTLLLF